MPVFVMKQVTRPEGGRLNRDGAEYDYGKGLNNPVAFTGQTVPLTHDADNDKWKFGFWSVVGSALGDYIDVSPSIDVVVGTSDVTVKAWFILRNPSPKNQTGVAVDAFDVDTGSFFDDEFVAVTSGILVSAGVTKKANVDGFVPTAQEWSVDAKGTVGSHGFQNWLCVDGTQETIKNGVLTAAKGTSSQAIAFFKTLPMPVGPSPRTPMRGTWVSWGVKVDGGGPTGGGPIGPGGPLMMEIAAGLALAEAAGLVDASLRADVLKLASKQVSLASDRLQRAIDALAKEAKR
jgi:hypothetical protein